MKQYKKTILLLVSAVLVLTAAVGTTLAYLIAGAGPVTNTFTPTKITTEVKEDIENGVKNNVRIQNTGTTDAYIRAAVIVTWQDVQGNVYGQKPVDGEDYSIIWWNEGEDNQNNDDWFEKDGFYYHKKTVAAGGETSVLFTACSPIRTAPDDRYSLNVEILGSGIQSQPSTAVAEAWTDVKVVKEKDDDGNTIYVLQAKTN